ncbi:MAG: hypothetical protein JNM39_12805 [Bdellovibrionaceae bacterium]|nr:hypothetical protein [Pseudobdellovibrionaceae bacterium]
MKEHRGGVLRTVLIIVLAIVLVRFLPVVVRLIQAIAIGARGLWWVILPIFVMVLLIWRVKSRASRARMSKPKSDEQGLRDVTDSMDNG